MPSSQSACRICLSTWPSGSQILPRPVQRGVKSYSTQTVGHWSSRGPRIASKLSFRSYQHVRRYNSQSGLASGTSVIQQDATVAAVADHWLPILPSLTHALQDLPAALHLSGPYATSFAIVILTLTLRTTISLPVTFWQRRRSRRMVDHVLPEWQAAKSRLPVEIGKKMARRRASRAEYQLELNKAARETLGSLMKKHRCAPIPTFVVPLIVNIPIFLGISAIIRYGCVPPTPWGNEIAPFPWAGPSADSQASFAASIKILMDRGLDAEQISMLSPKQGLTLIERDYTGFGPLAFGMITLLGVELGAWRRRLTDPEQVLHEGAKEHEPKRKTQPRAASPPSPKEDRTVRAKSISMLRQTVISNTLRAASIVFVPIAMQVPSALLVYWLANSGYTVVQNALLAAMEGKEGKQK
ncbi:hypothetical protein K437DRAFT_253222 [Tilletiaria anomala UBC 951]|uniref:Membrane insertase YidC/Oxa/ALB C-terminal domain-containing protein n=1 Tax=Tilletiaria anomala (strain ATCC 24038 / CBS 436.72 / UBC 951) TaxID=1037660 RepID=A0A066WQC3_TILAU|nr:uncharacterized protein K437DRAFT_253222 [Tilletiaria anomala UBC 951]KDN53209.1 hypothetical protein K437DRAFT_253222 [Tilletiaria anomala UBC 951]